MTVVRLMTGLSTVPPTVRFPAVAASRIAITRPPIGTYPERHPAVPGMVDRRECGFFVAEELRLSYAGKGISSPWTRPSNRTGSCPSTGERSPPTGDAHVQRPSQVRWSGSRVYRSRSGDSIAAVFVSRAR